MGSRSSSSTTVSAALAAALLLSGCISAEPQRVRAAAIAPAGPVLLVGDSILVGARDYGDLDLKLRDAGWEPEIVAESGRSVLWGIEQMELRETVPRRVVVVLGSNPSPELGTFPEEITQLVDALVARGADRIESVPPLHADPERYADKARALIDAADETLSILDWPGLLGLHPEWFSGDGLHLTGDGYQELATYIAATIGLG